MGPYYLTALVKALGPVQEVIGYSKKTFDKRNVENPEVNYKEINVDVDTHSVSYTHLTLPTKDGV